MAVFGAENRGVNPRLKRAFPAPARPRARKSGNLPPLFRLFEDGHFDGPDGRHEFKSELIEHRLFQGLMTWISSTWFDISRYERGERLFGIAPGVVPQQGQVVIHDFTHTFTPTDKR